MDFNDVGKSFNFKQNDFSNIGINPKTFDNRYIKPPKTKEIPYKKLKYQYAQQLAKDIDFKNLDRVFCIVNGTFIFGDFIEAFIVENNINVLEMTISTLSMSKDNIDSLNNLLSGGFVNKLNLIVSDYFFSHERNGLVKYIYEKLDVDNKFQLAAAGTHCKTYQFKTEGGKHIIIHGSANLRSSSNIEQFVIEDNEDLYTFNQNHQNTILEKYRTINKSIRGKELWHQVATNQEKEAGQDEHPHQTDHR